MEPFKVKLEREREALKVEPDFHEPIFKTKEEVFQEMVCFSFLVFIVGYLRESNLNVFCMS